MTDFAYLAQGKLHVKVGDAPVRVIDSRFGGSVRQRALEMQKRNEWKTQGRGAQFMRGGVLWGVRDEDAEGMPIAVTGVTGNCSGAEMAYTLETPEVSGIFLVSDGGRQENRLFHTADFRVGQLHSCGEKLAFVVRHKGGGSNIGVMNADGTGFAEVTEGDTIDLAPRWVPGSRHEIVFQCAGIGRDQAGAWAGQAPFTVEKLDLESGQLTTLAEDPESDLIAPQVAADGALYYIRRPYRHPRAKVSAWRALVDFVLFPFRLLYALFQFLNFFTVRYTGKTLTTANDVRQRQADIRQMMVWGNLMDAERANRVKGDDDAPPLVPDTWKLIRQSERGQEEIAQGVLCFDLLNDGSVLFSNGSAIFCVDTNGKKERLHKDAFVQQVIALP